MIRKQQFKMASSRDRTTWSHIFKLYKEMPHLWDRSNSNYGNRSMMTDGYKMLTRIYREKVDKDANVSDLRLKMKNLRTTYYRELRKINKFKEKGEEYSPSLWYFEKLKFLSNPRGNECVTDTVESSSTVDPNEAKDDFEMEDDTHLILENSDTESDPIPTTSSIKSAKRKGLMNKKKDSFYTEQQNDHLVDMERYNTMKDEHWEVIGKSLGYQLRDLNMKQYTIVSKLISDAIYLGRLNKLTEASQIDVGSSVYAKSTSPHTIFTISGSGIQATDVNMNKDRNMTIKGEDDFDDED